MDSAPPDHPSAPGAAWTPRSVEVLTEQRARAIERFTQARVMAEQAATAADRSREARNELSRRLQVLRRQHDALAARTSEQRVRTSQVLGSAAPRRAVIAHRDGRFVHAVIGALGDAGVEVVARLDNGADVVGLAVAEQPDLVLVDDALEMLPAREVVRALREYCPQTLVVAQVDGAGSALREAGAAMVLAREVPPAHAASALLRLVSA